MFVSSDKWASATIFTMVSLICVYVVYHLIPANDGNVPSEALKPPFLGTFSIASEQVRTVNTVHMSTCVLSPHSWQVGKCTNQLSVAGRHIAGLPFQIKGSSMTAACCTYQWQLLAHYCL